MKAKRFLYWCLIGIFAALLLFSAYKIISYYTEINEGQQEYDELAQMRQEDMPTDPLPTVPVSTDPTAPEATQPIPTEPAMAEVIGPDGQPMPILPEYKLITLSTCDGETGGVGRLVVVAKLITE